mgnify:CR=1 FL=1
MGVREGPAGGGQEGIRARPGHVRLGKPTAVGQERGGWTGPGANKGGAGLRRFNQSEEGVSSRFLNPFNIFSVVQFPNSECTADTGQYRGLTLDGN